MAISRLTWDFSFSLSLLSKTTNLPVLPAGTPLTMKVFSRTSGATLATFTTAQGYITVDSTGRIVWAIPAAQMVGPLVADEMRVEIRRTDVTPNKVVLGGFWRVREATSS